MATVYVAIQQNFDRQVALKIMSPHLTGDPIFGERFFREAKIIASLNHRNIVPVYDVGQHENFHYLSMEYLPGGDLKSRIIAGVQPELALGVTYEIANALAFAHSKSYMHRDIKPENILFREDHTAVLTDFGIARALDTADANMTSTGMIVGSPHYMSPEQALAEKIDTRTDIYSLGVVFYETLIGKPLYNADSSIAAAIKHISEPIPELPPEYAFLQDIFEKMVAKKADDRFQTATEVAQALEPFLTVPATAWDGPVFRETGYETEGGTRIVSRPGVGEGGFPSGAHYPSGGSGPRYTPVPRVSTPRQNSGHSRQITFSTLTSEVPARLKTLWAECVEAASDAGVALATVAVLALVSALVLLGGEEETPAAKDPVAAQQETLKPMEVTEPAPPSQQSDVSGKDESSVVQVQLEGLKAKAQAAEAESRWEDAHRHYIAILALDVGNKEGLAGIQRIAGAYLDQARQAMEQGRDVGEAERFISEAVKISPTHPDIAPAQQQLQQLVAAIAEEEARRQRIAEEVAALLERAEQAIAKGNLIEPAGESANDIFRKVLALDESNSEAQAGLAELAETYLGGVAAALDNRNLADAESNWRAVSSISPGHPQLESYKSRLDALRQAEAEKAEKRQEVNRRVAELLAAAKADLDKRQYVSPKDQNALSKYRLVLMLDKDNESARQGLEAIGRHLVETVKNHTAKRDIEAAKSDLALLEEVVPESELARTAAGAVSQLEDVLRKEREQEEKALRLQQNAEKVALLLSEAEDAVRREYLMTPRGSSAYDKYTAVLAIEKDNSDALQGLGNIVAKYIKLASQALNNGNLQAAGQYIERSEKVVTEYPMPAELGKEVSRIKKSVERLAYLENVEIPLKNLGKWNAAFRDPKAITVENLGEAHSAYMALEKENVEDERITVARKLYANAFFALGKRLFKQDDMDVSRELIDKGLDIDPEHEDLVDLDARWTRRKEGKETFFDKFY